MPIADYKVKRLAGRCAIGGLRPISHVAKSLRISRATVRRYVVRITESGYSFEEFAALPIKQMRAALTNPVRNEPSRRYVALLKLFPAVHENLCAGQTDLRSIWKHYTRSQPGGYRYSQFVAHFRRWQYLQGLDRVRCTPWRITQVPAADLAELKTWRRSNDRRNWAKAVVVLDSCAGTGLMSLCAKVEKSPRLVKKWLARYKQGGIDCLLGRERNYTSPDKLAERKTKRDRIIEILHEHPHLHDVNRTSWSLTTLARVYETQYGESIGKTTVSEYIRAEGYAFRKARIVLTSPDPNYREKLQEITRILSSLQENEKFFSIDEFGPFSVKMRGGRTFTPKGTMRVVPQRQRSKGRLIMTGALELSTNQITHFYSEKKNTEEMIKLLEILLREYSDQSCLYLSWDAASWHMSGRLNQRVSEINAIVENEPTSLPMVKLAPLPASAQFLNVIESVFSGMARAVLHNSDYESVNNCKESIDNYLAERNESYRKNPKRAGKKIWGNELVEPLFSPSNNCKDPNWR